MSSEPSVISPPDAIGGNRLAARIAAGPPPPLPAAADPAREPRSTWLRPAVIVAGICCCILVLGGYLVSEVAGSDSTAASLVSEIGQLAAALVATAASCVAITRHSGRPRRSWILVALACGSWSLGQLYWCIVVLGPDGAVAQVSIADPFFLTFTALMA